MKKTPDFLPSQIADDQLSFSFIKEETKTLMSSQASIKNIVGDIQKGGSRIGLTGGQFSLSDLIEYLLIKSGPADVYLSTWAASSDGIKKAFEFLNTNKIRNIKFMIDTGAKQYRNEEFGKLLDRFGDCVRTTRIHAKFVVIRNENFNFVVRTSANLNRNTRLELFEIDDNKDLADFFVSFFDNAFKNIKIEDNHSVKSSRKLSLVLDKENNRKQLNVDNGLVMDFNLGDFNYDL